MSALPLPPSAFRRSSPALLTCLFAQLVGCSVYDESLLPDQGGNAGGVFGTGGDVGAGGSGGSNPSDGGTGNTDTGGGTGSGGDPTEGFEYTAISHMEMTADQIDLPGGGYWFTAWATTTPCITPSGAGNVVPVALAEPRSLPGFSPSDSTYAMHFVTTDCTGWGSQGGFGLQAGEEEGSLDPFDASEYDGIAFWAKASSTEKRVRIDIADVNTHPSGGLCDEASSISSEQCHGNYALLRTVTEDWQLWRVPFADMRQPSHGNRGGLTPDTTQLYQIVFSFFPSNDIDIWFDDVYFYKQQP